MTRPAILLFTFVCLCTVITCASAEDVRPHIQIRGIYGGVPVELMERGELQDYGVNAIFMGSGSINAERLGLLKKQGVKVFAEFNTMHVAGYVKEHPDSAPVGVDGKACPPPEGWARRLPDASWLPPLSYGRLSQSPERIRD